METATAIALVILVVVAYGMPTIVAVANKSRYIAPAVIINILLGWTFIGWVVAMVFAAMPAPMESPRLKD